MGQNYRNQSGRSDYGRGERYLTDSDRSRNRLGGEERYNPGWEDRPGGEDRPDWEDRNASRAYQGERSYSEEFGPRRSRPSDPQTRDYRGSSQHDRGFGNPYGSSTSRDEERRFDEANRWSQGSRNREDDAREDFYARDRGTTTSRWHEDQGDSGSYFGTGSYIDDGGASRGFGADLERARAQVRERYGSGLNRGTDAQYDPYARSRYGSRSPSEQARSYGGSYEDRSSWDYDRRPGQRARAPGYDVGGAGPQSHRGRGPQGYQRSDERLREMICERLTEDPTIDASNLTVEVTGQTVKLTGTVDDRRTKFEIEELIEDCGGVKDIDNQLRVQSKQSNWNQTAAQSTTASQQSRSGSDWDAGSSSLASSGTTTGRSTSSSSTGASTSGSSKRN